MKNFRLKIGNSKLKNILVFDLPYGQTCPNHTDCIKNCYAKKAERQYPNVRSWRADNLTLTKDPLTFQGLINEQLAKTKLTVVRIHSSGDFYSQDYLNTWGSIAQANPTKVFFAFTKTNWSLGKLPANMNVISSLINGKLNFGPRVYVEALARDTGAYICESTHPYDTSLIQCGVNCTYCHTNKKVVFVQH